MTANATDWPALSVIIISKDRRADLDRCLASLREVEYPPERRQIVVVEECDNPRLIADVSYVTIPRENRGWGHARNIGLRHAQHALLVFTDDDCQFDRRWLKELVGTLQDRPDIAGVSGGVLARNANAVGQCEIVLGFPNGGLRRIHAARGRIVETRDMSTCNCLYKREVFDRMGGFFDKRNTRATDMEFGQRAAREFRFVFNPNALVYHKPRGSLRKVFRWFVERGRSQFLIGDALPERRRHYLYNLKNSLTVRLALLTGLLTAMGPFWRWRALAVMIPAYYLVVLRRYAFQWRYAKRLDAFFLTPVVKFVMDVGMETGRLRQLLARGRKAGKP